MIFGDVPWITKELNTNSEELYAPRTPRAEVMDSILLCINKAVDGLPEKGQEEDGRLNKDMANFLKARICLLKVPIVNIIQIWDWMELSSFRNVKLHVRLY